jgi:hypothetical protein
MATATLPIVNSLPTREMTAEPVMEKKEPKPVREVKYIIN